MLHWCHLSYLFTLQRVFDLETWYLLYNCFLLEETPSNHRRVYYLSASMIGRFLLSVQRQFFFFCILRTRTILTKYNKHYSKMIWDGFGAVVSVRMINLVFWFFSWIYSLSYKTTWLEIAVSARDTRDSKPRIQQNTKI